MKKKIDGIPWESREELGFPKAIGATLAMALLKPKDFWEHLRINDSFTEPYLFFLGMAIPVFFIQSVVQGLIGRAKDPLFFWVALFWVIVSVVIRAQITFLFVKAFRGKKSYRETFNITAYGLAAVSIFQVVPFIGTWISLAWSFFVIPPGLKNFHGFSLAQANLVYVLSMTVCFVLAAALAASGLFYSF